MDKETIKIGIPMELTNEDGTIENVVLLRSNEIKAIEYKLQELVELEYKIKELTEYVEKMSFGDIVNNPKQDLVKILRKEKE